MITPESHPQRLRVAHLNPNAPTTFHLRPDEGVREALAAELGLDALTRLDFRATLRAHGTDIWLLTATLAARLTQPCVITLKPVRTDISEPVRIQFSRMWPPRGRRDRDARRDAEPLGNFIDLTAIMVEALSLALPAYSAAEGASLPQAAAADDDAAGDTRRPFAGLDKLQGGKDGES